MVHLHKRAPVVATGDRLVIGRAYVAMRDGRPVVDADGDLVTPSALQAAAHGYLQTRQVLALHDGEPVGEVVESLVTVDASRPELGGVAGDVAWVVAMRVTDDATWARVASGELGELSIGGSAERVATERPADALVHESAPDATHRLEGLSVHEISLVPRGAGIDVTARVYKARVAKGLQKMEHEKNLEALAEMLTAEQMEMVRQAIAAATAAASPATEEKMEDEEEKMEDEEKGYAKALRLETERLRKQLSRETELLRAQLEEERESRAREAIALRLQRDGMSRLPLPQDLLVSIERGAERVAKGERAEVTLTAAEAVALSKGLQQAGRIVAESSLFRSAGTDRHYAAPGSAREIVAQRATELRKAHPEMGEAQARLRVCESDPALARRYSEEG